MSTPPKPSFLLDTGPLSVLCGFPIQETSYLHMVLQYAMVILTDTVAGEIQGAGKMARVITPLLKSGGVTTLPTPAAPSILDTSYGRDLALGERSVIKAALATGSPPILDDKHAFIAACRFGLRPLGFQDFIVRLVKEQGLPKNTAIEIVRTTARQFPTMFLAHTLDMLNEE